jgi:p-hydroxybenzoic acid efflux pump subunit AaeB
MERGENSRGMRGNLIMESSRWSKVNQRLKAINTLSLTLITQATKLHQAILIQ